MNLVLKKEKKKENSMPNDMVNCGFRLLHNIKYVLNGNTLGIFLSGDE